MNPFHQFFREIHIAVRKSRKNRERVNHLSSFLKCGRYKNSISYDCVYRRDLKPIIRDSTFSSKLAISQAARCLISLYNSLVQYTVKGKNGEKVFHATEIVFSSSQTEVKLFDFKSRQVLTIFSSVDKMLLINNNKRLFSTSFLVPSTLLVNKEESYLIEDLVFHEKYDVETAFDYLSDSLFRYISLSIDKTREQDELYQVKCRLFANRFGQSDLFNDSVGSIMCTTHGDLWSSNIIYNGREYYITDFERVGKRFCLFDFFFFIFTEWHLNNDGRLLDNYFAGRYDEQLFRVFSVLGIPYEINKREEYFLSFLVSITYERWKRQSETDVIINRFIKLYIPLYSKDF